MEEFQLIQKLYRIDEALEKRFPGNRDPFRILARLMEESGELADQVHLWEDAGRKRASGRQPDETELAKEIKQVLLAALDIARYYGVQAQLEQDIQANYARAIREGLIETGHLSPDGSTPTTMKQHLQAALREQFDQWEKLLTSLSEEQATAPSQFSSWSVKDLVAHLMAWQQRSIARMEAAGADQEPALPVWLPGLDPEDEETTEPVNAWIYAQYHALPWLEVYAEWRAGFLRFLAATERITEKDLLDSSRHSWLAGYSLADVLLGSYDHHQEHYEGLLAALPAASA
ncbi:MAG: ClbS/DfsB family four-helix bundle protein [Anaerolineales bacterium]|nr:ClbS/DfsB family four-helix bundle protein [Anaerolineales bacterium]